MILKKSKWAGKLLKQEITEMKAEIKALKKTENVRFYFTLTVSINRRFNAVYTVLPPVRIIKIDLI